MPFVINNAQLASVQQPSLSMVPTKHLLADIGAYFTTTTPTPGTGITPNAVETSFSDTRGFIVIQNQAPVRGKRIYLDYIRLLLGGTAPTATTVLHFVGKRSQISREPTTAANRTLLTPVNVASQSGVASIARPMMYANAGAMTVPASAAADPILFRASIPTSLGVTGDEYILKFGGEDIGAVGGLTAVRATAATKLSCAPLPPVIIEPAEWLVIHRWWLTEATNAPAFELEMGWWEA